MELYDPVSGTSTLTGSLITQRYNHTASLLPNGTVLLAGGIYGNALSSVEFYNPVAGTNTATALLKTARNLHTATLLANGKVFVAGGLNGNPFSSTEVYDYAAGTNIATGNVIWTTDSHTATLLPNGKVLKAAGFNSGSMNYAELFNPSNGTWNGTAWLNQYRFGHTAKLLDNGKVLVSGGYYNVTFTYLTNCEIYDPVSGKWTNTGSLNIPRVFHTATLLPNGKVLVAGGFSKFYLPWGNALTDAELYDPATSIWTISGAMNYPRQQHTATLLPTGKVLVAGYYAQSELYDPSTGTWIATGSMNVARILHTATLLPNGQVLVAGGSRPDGASIYYSSSELYDPSTGNWTLTGSLASARNIHTATLLPNGKVLVTGGYNGTSLSGAELYDPTTRSWSGAGAMTVPRGGHTATLLPSGKFLLASGRNSSEQPSAELYDVGLGYSNSWQPQITAFTSPLNLGSSLVVTGAQFRGVSEGSSGNSQDSSADYPLVQLRSIESGQIMFLSSTNWRTNSFTSLPVWNFPPGLALATVFVNGIQSTSSIVNISVPIPTTTTLTGAQQSNGSFQFGFTNNPGVLFGVLAAR